MDQSAIYDFVRNNHFFAACDDSFCQNHARSATVVKGEKGKVLFTQDDPATRYYIPVKGWVKIYRETLDGSQAVIDILTTGYVFGDTSIYEDDVYPYTAELAEDGMLISLPLSELKSEIERNGEFALSMLRGMARYRRQQDRELEHRIIQNAPQRIGCFLLRLMKGQTVGSVTINLPYDKTLVASRLGMQPETFSRALNKLKEQTGIQIQGGTILVDQPETLMDFSCSACSFEYPCQDL